MTPRISSRIAVRRRAGAFTLIELLVMMVLMMILMGLAFPAMREIMAKAKLESTTQQVATMFLSSRYQAIRHSTSAQITIEIDNTADIRWIESVLDRNADGVFDADDPTDQVIGRLAIPSSLVFAAPGTQDVIDGFTATTVDCTVVMRPDGSADRNGAVRLTALKEGSDYFEVRIPTSATARVEINVWDEVADKWKLFTRAEADS